MFREILGVGLEELPLVFQSYRTWSRSSLIGPQVSLYFENCSHGNAVNIQYYARLRARYFLNKAEKDKSDF